MAQKILPVGDLFGGVLRPQTHMGTCGPRPYLGPKKSNMANKAQNRDLMTLIDR